MQSDCSQLKNRPRRVVVKFGTGILTRPEGDELDLDQFQRLTTELAEIHHGGTDVVLVSSGAVGAGLMALGLHERPEDLPTIQACAAIGQTRLMEIYQSHLDRHGLLVAQLLLTPSDLDSRERYINARNTLNTLLKQRRVIPIINENDSVATEALKFSDNDKIAAEVGVLVDAELLVILSEIEGLTRSPDGSGEHFRVVEKVSDVEDFAGTQTGKRSRGGMRSKLQAVKIAVSHGVRTVICNGRKAGLIAAAMEGEEIGTTFLPDQRAPREHIPVY